jgi:hypothetical protein
VSPLSSGQQSVGQEEEAAKENHERGIEKMSPVLKLDSPDEEKELEFELVYQRTLTSQQRFELMFRRSREMAEALLRHGYRKPFEIVKRS